MVKSGDLETQRAATLRRIFAFLGADAEFSSPLFFRRRNVGKEQPTPTALGSRLEDSCFMRMAERVLHPGLFYHFRNLLLRPFSNKVPAKIPLSDVPESLQQRFARELKELKDLSGCDLSLSGKVR